MNKDEFCDNCKIEKNEIYGRYVTAAKDIQAGEILLEEKPTIVLPQCDAKICCSNCFKEYFILCKKCGIFPLCANCSNHDNFDCEFFQNVEELDKNFFINYFQTFSVIKCLMLMEKNKKKWDIFMQSESHLNERKGTSVWQQYEQNVVVPIMKSGIIQYFKNEKVNEELLQTICGILDVNTFELRGPQSGISLRGVYLNAALLAHSCISNTMITVDEANNMKIYAAINIKDKEIIYNNYTNPLLGTVERQTYLKIGKYFECQCNRCKDPTEFGTYLSAIKYRSCSNGHLLYYINDKNWKCDNCSIIVENSTIQEILSKINEEFNNSKNDLRKLELLIKINENQLSSHHFLLIDIKQTVASILRKICMESYERPGKLLLKRKIQICEEILLIVRKLQLGISRLTAITFYEYFTPLVDLASAEYEDEEITDNEYLEKLKNCEGILKESIEMLLYEPINTPEGQLSRSALIELKELTETIRYIETNIK